MFCQMSPVIEHSIVKVAPGKWLMGSSMICHSDLSAPPADVVASWTDDNKTTFYLSKGPTAPGLTSVGDEIGELSEIDRVHNAGTSAAVWAFGGVHIKVKGWVPELQLEHVTIDHVRKTKPNIPMPEVIFSWTDEAWDRTFLVLVSIPGRTLYQAWPELRPQQKQQIADEVASHCTDLALSCSRQMETLSGKGISEPHLTRCAAPEVPSWRPNVQGPFTADQLKVYLRDPLIIQATDFCFYHADLGPTNIMLDSQDRIAAIIDWESAAFWPQFWIATKPLVSAGFNLPAQSRSEWAFMLSSALEDQGFVADLALYRKWKAAVNE